MAVRHIKEYYGKVAQQYLDLLDELKDFEKLANEGMFEPEKLDQIKENIKPLMTNYQTLSYIMFLLNMPNRKSKEKSYKNANKRKTSQIPNECTQEGVIQQNKDAIDSLNNLKK